MISFELSVLYNDKTHTHTHINQILIPHFIDVNVFIIFINHMSLHMNNIHTAECNNQTNYPIMGWDTPGGVFHSAPRIFVSAENLRK